MNKSSKSSFVMAISGISLIVLAVGIAAFVFPDANQKRITQISVAKEARNNRDSQRQDLNRIKAKDKEIRESRQRMDEVLSNMSGESEGQLKWKLRKALHAIGNKHGIRIHSVKYGPLTKEGSKGTDLESIDVELVCSGVYQSVKSFMLGLETSNLPFGISNGRLDEGPDGIRLTLSLRAFRRAGAKQEIKREGA